MYILPYKKKIKTSFLQLFTKHKVLAVFIVSTYVLTPVASIRCRAPFFSSSLTPGGGPSPSSAHFLSNMVVSVKAGHKQVYLIPLSLLAGFCCRI